MPFQMIYLFICFKTFGTNLDGTTFDAVTITTSTTSKTSMSLDTLTTSTENFKSKLYVKLMYSVQLGFSRSNHYVHKNNQVLVFDL